MAKKATKKQDTKNQDTKAQPKLRSAGWLRKATPSPTTIRIGNP